MEVYVIVYLLLFLNDFSVGENAESFAIRNQNKCQQSGVVINTLMPQKLYAVPNIVSKLNPTQLNVKLDNTLHTVPEILIPLVNKEKSTSTQNATTLKELKPIFKTNNCKEPEMELKCPKKNEKPKEYIQKVDNLKEKDSHLFEVVDQDDITYFVRKKETFDKSSQENKLQDKIKKEDTKSDSNSLQKTKSILKSNQEKPEHDNPSKNIPLVNQKDTKLIIETNNYDTELPEHKTETNNIGLKQESGRRANNPGTIEIVPEVVDNNAKDTVTPITIYNFNDITGRHTKIRDSEPSVFIIGTDQSTNQHADNVLIKNQNVEELCERSEHFTNTYEINQPQYYNNGPAEENYYPNNYFPHYQYGIPQYNPKDRVWRNWKTTEIYITKSGLKNNQYHIYNGFNTPFMYGDIRYNAYKNNIPLHQCYAYPKYT